jgi:simple sugar transport system ATP-binding protein
VSFDVRAGEVHALLGENGAGKSTLMSVISGIVKPDAGHLEIDGQPAPFGNPRATQALGVGMVYQHFKLVPTMSVVENVALSLGRRRQFFTRFESLAQRLVEIATKFGVEVDPYKMVGDLSIGEQQRVEILKALYMDSQILILDEPSSVLTPTEWGYLQKSVKAFAEAGKSVVFVTHKLEELLSIADRCTVLRDGEVVGRVEDVGQTDARALARMMVGRDVALRIGSPAATPGRVVVAVSGLRAQAEAHAMELSDVSFELREGEVLGIAGVDGNGQRELVEVLSGLRRMTAGEIRIDGEVVSDLAPAAFRQLGGAVIPEDRHESGLALGLSLRDNLVVNAVAAGALQRAGLLRNRAVERWCGDLVARFDIRAAGLDAAVDDLSGGNQQKVVLAREMAGAPRFVLAAHPTRGLDVGAIEFVLNELGRYKHNGGAVLLLSAELDQLLAFCDRIAVMVDGRLSAAFAARDATLEDIGLLLGGAGMFQQAPGGSCTLKARNGASSPTAPQSSSGGYS